MENIGLPLLGGEVSYLAVFLATLLVVFVEWREKENFKHTARVFDKKYKIKGGYIYFDFVEHLIITKLDTEAVYEDAHDWYLEGEVYGEQQIVIEFNDEANPVLKIKVDKTDYYNIRISLDRIVGRITQRVLSQEEIEFRISRFVRTNFSGIRSVSNQKQFKEIYDNLTKGISENYFLMFGRTWQLNDNTILYSVLEPYLLVREVGGKQVGYVKSSLRKNISRDIASKVKKSNSRIL